MASIVSRSRTMELTSVREQMVKDRRAIVAALKRRDWDTAREAMLQHLNTAEELPLRPHPLASHASKQARRTEI